jgi:hypothetical protein
MATIKEISSADIKTSKSALNQLVDIIQEDVSGSVSRRSYQVFVTGSGPTSVTASLFQTVYDQDYTLQTANPMFDLTVGLWYSGSTVQNIKIGEDTAGKLLFPSSSIQMREKIDVYRQHAGKLLGDASQAFYSPFQVSTDPTTTSADRIDNALFLNFKRLFARDKIKRETFAMRFYTTGVIDGTPNANRSTAEAAITLAETTYTGSNLFRTSTSGSAIFTDVGAASSKRTTFGGEVGEIVDAGNTARKVGLMFYDAGTAVLDLSKLMWGEQHVSGVISSVAGNPGSSGDPDDLTAYASLATNETVIGSSQGGTKINTSYGSNASARFIPDFLTSGSIDDIVDHISAARFSSGSNTAVTFQNVTNINSTLLFCRATADEFNYSSNPTFVDGDGRIVVIDQGQEDTQRAFSFITTVGMYDANDNLLAVAKLSRPIEKNDEKDLTIRIRLDF